MATGPRSSLEKARTRTNRQPVVQCHSPRAVDQLRRQLDALGVLDHPIREPGNMSYRVRLISPDATHYWTWTEEGVLTEWYRRAETLCQRRDDTN